MLMVMSFFSPPYRMSASASAVSVLPTPEGPTNMNTPRGLLGSSRRALAVRTRWATAASAWSWPMTRSASRVSRLRTVLISSLTMRPSGTPVQAETISATTWPSTCSGTIGVVPCRARSSARRASSSSRAGSAVVVAFLRLVARAGAFSATAGAASGCCAADSSRCARSARMRSTSAFSSARRCWLAASSACSALFFSASSARRASWRPPAAVSRTSAALSASMRSRPRFASSISAGVALWPSATFAQAVSSTLTALSGSCRPLM
ncbi:hypothetical protein D3C71_423380 [compost metagenome]